MTIFFKQPPLQNMIVGALVASCTVGCTSFDWKSFSINKQAHSLTLFTARDGNYFPGFIVDFFPSTTTYSSEFPSLAEARSQMQLIEVKRLNDDNNAINESNLSWSADGVYLSFEFVSGNQRRIQVKNLAGDYSRELVVIPKGRNDFLDGIVSRSIQSYNAALSWSLDSTRYAFMSNGGVGEYNIYVGAVGGKDEPVARSAAKDGYATWSPIANELAFVSSRTGNGDIYLVELDRKTVAQLSYDPKVDIFPQWFPSGKAIVYSSGDAMQHNLHVVRRDKGGAWQPPEKLTDWPQDDLRPSVSPDGNLVAFYSTDIERRQADGPVWNIHVVPYKVGRTYSMKELPYTVVAEDVIVDLNTGPAWTPDSRKILFVKRDPAAFNPIHGYDLFTGRSYVFNTGTKMNRDILVSRLGILSFRAQVGVWDRVFLALTNQGVQLQGADHPPSRIHYLRRPNRSAHMDDDRSQYSL